MEIWPVETDKAPAAIGPYSQGITTDGYVFCSGQVALDASTGELVDGPVADQTRRAMENLSAVLAAAGTSLNHVVKTTIYLTDMNDFAEVNDAYGSFFEGRPPARATVGVSALPKGARVEIDCIARV
ncbi:MAG TPA: RidA family protein [Actinomycetota bacterium]|nr:RidA family protein [Actinomycetota bacterium]